MDVPAFLQWRQGVPSRVELVAGEPIPMTTPGKTKQRIVSNIYEVIWSRSDPPHGAMTEGAVALPHRADALYFPALAVTERTFAITDVLVPDPAALVEVVEPGEEAFTLGVKLQDYVRIASVLDVLVVWAAERRVQHWRRESSGVWRVEVREADGELQLNLLDGPLGLDEMYEEG